MFVWLLSAWFACVCFAVDVCLFVWVFVCLFGSLLVCLRVRLCCYGVCCVVFFRVVLCVGLFVSYFVQLLVWLFVCSVVRLVACLFAIVCFCCLVV